jgi:hypothetical protein
MKTNYINQLQRDLIGEIGRDEPQEQSILSIEDKAVNYAYERFGSSNETQIEWEDCQEHFIAGANEMLPIIKELLEALIKTCPNVYDYKELINKAKNL